MVRMAHHYTTTLLLASRWSSHLYARQPLRVVDFYLWRAFIINRPNSKKHRMESPTLSELVRQRKLLGIDDRLLGEPITLHDGEPRDVHVSLPYGALFFTHHQCRRLRSTFRDQIFTRHLAVARPIWVYTR